MKKTSAATALLLAVSMMTAACSKHDDATNQSGGNDTQATDQTEDANLSAADAPVNGSELQTNLSTPMGNDN